MKLYQKDTDRYHINYWMAPINRFIHRESASSTILVISLVLALFLANSPWKENYFDWWHVHLSISFGSFELNKTLHHWINDGLMSVFFFVVGLELKREIIGGELSNPKHAILPIAAAIGGMLFPALMYVVFNFNTETSHGWGIPMATDIAFALGILYVFGKRVPTSLKVFLTALAVVDDLGAVLVIAFFYTSDINLISLGIGAVFMAVLLLGNFLKVRNTLFYGLIGIGGLWLAFMLSGVHATIAGVLAAFAIPAKTAINQSKFKNLMDELLSKFSKSKKNNSDLVTMEQLDLLEAMKKNVSFSETPLQKLEHALHPFVAFVVIPVFAFANAGITFDQESFGNLATPLSLGIIFGLLAGKFIGVVGLSKLVVGLKWTTLPSGMKWPHVYALSFLAAIGFTMSIFIAELAFTGYEKIQQAKMAILIASILAAAIGSIILNKTLDKET
jgi:NhaA family Na+:H+ antiporter